MHGIRLFSRINFTDKPRDPPQDAIDRRKKKRENIRTELPSIFNGYVSLVPPLTASNFLKNGDKDSPVLIVGRSII